MTTENKPGLYMYDELRCNGVPSQAVAKTILADLNSGKAIPHPISEPGFKGRLEDIVAGRPVDPQYWQFSAS